MTPYEQQQQSRQQSAQISDEQIGETLRRATAASQMEGSDYGTSPDGDEPMSTYSGQYTPEQRRDGVMQGDPKKRKRNFSNRTKTGCLTCRKRKKKCDEAKPECKLSLRCCLFFVVLARLAVCDCGRAPWSGLGRRRMRPFGEERGLRRAGRYFGRVLLLPGDLMVNKHTDNASR
jgi:hypothetical protein